jgi:hypothetical protein
MKNKIIYSFIYFDNWKLVRLRGEAVNEYGSAIRKLYLHKMVSVAGCCNDVSSYFII